MIRLVPLLLCIALLAPQPAHAHANLQDVQPGQNVRLDEPPTEIRLCFTEPVEPAFSRISLRDSTGAQVAVPEAFVDPSDAHALVVSPLPPLGDGVYTVVWSVVSAADGHYTRGSYAFSVGVALQAGTDGSAAQETVPPVDTLARAANLAALVLLTGVGVFRAWMAPAALDSHSPIHARLRRLHLAGWALTGCALGAMLLLQLRLIAGEDAGLGEQLSRLPDTLLNTRFGTLFLIRAALWLALLPLIGRGGWPMLAVTAAILLTHSLFSHASAARDGAAVAADWLHLLAAGAWLGGLAAFLLALASLRRSATGVHLSGILTAHFSNLARACVIVLALTGAYSAWLHIGSLEALTGTAYGVSMLAKLALFAPLLGVTAINLILTARALRRGDAVWAGRLRGLIGAELALGAGILLAAGAMTSIQPARAALAAMQTQTVPPEPAPYFAMQVAPDGVMAHLEFGPGWAGENEFVVTLFDERGAAVEDASLLRLRFENPTLGIAESDLRLEPAGRGAYRAVGANLSAGGEWQVRMTARRPGAFDTVLDFNPQIGAEPPPQRIQPPFEPDAAARFTAAALVGIALAGAGGSMLALASRHRDRRRAAGITGGLLTLGTGVLFILTAAGLWTGPGHISATQAWSLPAREGANASIYLTLTNSTASERILTGGQTDAAESVQFHSATTNSDDLAAMTRIDTVVIPAGGTFSFAPGDAHIMLEHTTRQLSPGDSITLTLSFDDGTTLTTQAGVTLEPPF
jgi:copper transport protein